MAEVSRGRAAFKFLFWTAAAAGLFIYVAQMHRSGKLAEWFYHTAATDGYAVDADSFRDATKALPAQLAIRRAGRIAGLIAVPVKQGERLPLGANGVIGRAVLEEGKRATVDGGELRVMVPWEMQQAKGFKFKDTFKHKGIKTYPWAGLWNVLLIVGLGLSLGFMAEGLTDLLGIKLEKIKHFEGH